MSNAIRDRAVGARVTLLRYWLASALLLLLVVAAAFVQLVRTPREYVASQQLQVVALTDSNDVASAARDASTVASALVDPSVLTSPRMAGDVLASLPANVQAEASVTDLQGAFSGSASGGTITLTATWTSSQTTQDLLGAAVTALQTDDALTPSSVSNDMSRIQPLAPATSATPSSDQEEALVQTLLQRILMGLLAAALLPFVLDALLATPASSPRTA